MVKLEGLFEFQTGMNSDMAFHNTSSFFPKDYREFLFEKIGSEFNHFKLHILVPTISQPTIPEQAEVDRMKQALLKLEHKKVRITVEELE